MKTRPLGSTGHDSTVMTFGAIALNWLEQEGANQMVEFVLDHGINHFDVAPSYGDAELKLRPKLRQYRDKIFLGCKTQEREYDGAKRKLKQSLTRLGTDHIDLYQIHGLEYENELEIITEDGGALEAFREAKEDGLIDHIGLTSHGSPQLILDAIDRIDDLETVMFPMNPIVAGKDDPKYDYEAVFKRANESGLGILGIKAFAKGVWPPEDELSPKDRPYSTWYKPVDTSAEIRERFNFVASHKLTSVINPGDPKLVAMVVNAAEQYEQMDDATKRSVIERLRHEESPVPEQLHH